MATPFIVLEGIDGAGTTTQAERLVRALRGRALKAHATREPSAGPIGVFLRRLLTGELTTSSRSPEEHAAQLALLFAADRLEHVASEVAPRQRDGEWVISDRYDYSSVAYQHLTGGASCSVAWLRELNRAAPRPDLTIVLDVSPEVALRRRLARNAARELFDDEALQQRLARFYSDVEQHFPGDRIVHVDGERSVDDVLQEVLELALTVSAGR